MRDVRLASSRISRWLPVVFCAIPVAAMLYSAVRKFLEHSYRVQQFESYGNPFPELPIPLMGVIELVAIISLAFGFAGRLRAGVLVVGTMVATVAAGSNPFDVLVLVASAGILVVGTGPYSCWNPTVSGLSGETTTGVPRLTRRRSAQ